MCLGLPKVQDPKGKGKGKAPRTGAARLGADGAAEPAVEAEGAACDPDSEPAMLAEAFSALCENFPDEASKSWDLG